MTLEGVVLKAQWGQSDYDSTGVGPEGPVVARVTVTLEWCPEGPVGPE